MTEKLKMKDTALEIKNKLGVSQCPGKKLERGRDGKAHNRNIEADVMAYN
jgi:hypothetical protein